MASGCLYDAQKKDISPKDLKDSSVTRKRNFTIKGFSTDTPSQLHAQMLDFYSNLHVISLLQNKR